MKPIVTEDSPQSHLGIFWTTVHVRIVKKQNNVPALLWQAALFERRAFSRHRLLDQPGKFVLRLPLPFGAGGPLSDSFLDDYAII